MKTPKKPKKIRDVEVLRAQYLAQEAFDENNLDKAIEVSLKLIINFSVGKWGG